jgi:ABC-type cobalamin/Fe3+-siderophores transport system ATPase subunit
MRYFLGGVNGAGKTTLLGEIGKYFPEIEIVKGSKNLMDYLGISGNYDALRAMTQKERDIALRIIIENLFLKTILWKLLMASDKKDELAIIRCQEKGF